MPGEPERSSTSVAFPHGIMFHRLHAEGGAPEGQGSLSPRQFEAILRRSELQHILPPSEWVRRLREGTLDEMHRCITFDDGLAAQYRIARPVLDALGLKAFWFVHSGVFEGQVDWNELAQVVAARFFATFADFASEFVARSALDSRMIDSHPAFLPFTEEVSRSAPFYSRADTEFRFIRNRLLSGEQFARLIGQMVADRGESIEHVATDIWMTDNHLRTLVDNGHWIGLHTYNHPFDLASMSSPLQEDQYRRNRAHIERVTGEAVRSMAHPLNSYSRVTLDLLGRMGIECGFRSDCCTPHGKAINPGPLEMARVDATQLKADSKLSEPAG